MNYYTLHASVSDIVLLFLCVLLPNKCHKFPNLAEISQQEDIRSYIDSSLKRGAHLSLFRKERFGGDSHGTFYW